LDEKGKNTDVLQAKLADMEKTMQEKEAELSAARFEASNDYKEKFEIPYRKVWFKTKAYVDALEKPDGTPAKFDSDFVELLRTPHAHAPAKARELFGDDHAMEILAQRRRLLEMEEDANEAITGEKQNWEANQKKRQESARLEELKRNQQRQEQAALYNRVVEEIGKSVPGYSDPVGENEDKEATELRSKELSFYDTKPNTPQEYIEKLSHMRHRYGAFPVLQLHNKRLELRVAELEAALAETKDSQPLSGGSRKPGGGTVAAPEKDYATELKETLRNVRQ